MNLDSKIVCPNNSGGGLDCPCNSRGQAREEYRRDLPGQESGSGGPGTAAPRRGGLPSGGREGLRGVGGRFRGLALD